MKINGQLNEIEFYSDPINPTAIYAPPMTHDTTSTRSFVGENANAQTIATTVKASPPIVGVPFFPLCSCT